MKFITGHGFDVRLGILREPSLGKCTKKELHTTITKSRSTHNSDQVILLNNSSCCFMVNE